MVSSVKAKPLICPSCGKAIRFAGDIGPAVGLRVRCSECGVNVVIVIKASYHWLLVAVCVGIGLISASLRGIQEPLLAIQALLIASCLLILATRLLSPYLPMKAQLDFHAIQRLGL